MRTAASLSALLALLAGAASAQTTTRDSTPFVIHAVPADGAVRTARPGEPLLVQPATSVRAARLDAEAPTTSGYRKVKSFPAGAVTFGAHGADGWVYCAVAASTARWWAGDEFACYEDADGDGRFDAVRLSGEPFLGVPLFVFDLGPAKPLPRPVPYTRIRAEEGPRIDYALAVKVERPRGKRGQPAPAATALRLIPQLGREGRYAPVGGAGSVVPLAGGQTAVVEHEGARIAILGVLPDGSVRYRVDQPMPAQIKTVTMGVTTTTRYVPIVAPG